MNGKRELSEGDENVLNEFIFSDDVHLSKLIELYTKNYEFYVYKLDSSYKLYLNKRLKNKLLFFQMT